MEYESHLALRHVSKDFHTVFFAHPINQKGLVVFYIFHRLIYIFKDDFTKSQYNSKTKGTFFQNPGVFQDQGQIQGLFQVCVNSEIYPAGFPAASLKKLGEN